MSDNISVNRKSIRFLRGGKNFNPDISDEILADGQPFVSHKTNKLYIGDGVTPLRDLDGAFLGDPVADLNLSKGTGANSITQCVDPSKEC